MSKCERPVLDMLSEVMIADLAAMALGYYSEKRLLPEPLPLGVIDLGEDIYKQSGGRRFQVEIRRLGNCENPECNCVPTDLAMRLLMDGKELLPLQRVTRHPFGISIGKIVYDGLCLDGKGAELTVAEDEAIVSLDDETLICKLDHSPVNVLVNVRFLSGEPVSYPERIHAWADPLWRIPSSVSQVSYQTSRAVLDESELSDLESDV